MISNKLLIFSFLLILTTACAQQQYKTTGSLYNQPIQGNKSAKLTKEEREKIFAKGIDFWRSIGLSKEQIDQIINLLNKKLTTNITKQEADNFILTMKRFKDIETKTKNCFIDGKLVEKNAYILLIQVFLQSKRLTK